MATKLDILLDFTNGQGVVGGASQYLNYGPDFDTNFTSIQTTVNLMIDELTAARLQDAAIPRDILVSSDIESNNNGAGRFSPNDVKITYSGATLTVSAGDMFINGQKVVTAGDTFSAVRANGLWYVATDINGLLSVSTSLGAVFGDIAGHDHEAARVRSAVCPGNTETNRKLRPVAATGPALAFAGAAFGQTIPQYFALPLRELETFIEPRSGGSVQGRQL